MLKNIIFLTLAVFFISCQNKNTKNSGVENLTPGSVVHESLSQRQLNQIEYIQETFYEVLPVSLEETIVNFKRDQNPDHEINIWVNMAKSYKVFLLKNPEEEKADLRKEAFRAIYMRSVMSEEEVINNSDSEFSLLTEHDIRELLSTYKLDPEPIKINKN